jgi:hypothetical protein
VIRDTASSVWQYLLLAALNRCVAPTSKSQIGSWYKKSVLARLLPLTANQLTSQRFWDNMERVSTTNFFTFLDSFNNRAELPQRGHAKQGHDNLALRHMRTIRHAGTMSIRSFEQSTLCGMHILGTPLKHGK